MDKMAINWSLLSKQIRLEKHLQLTNRHFLPDYLQEFFDGTVDFAVKQFTYDFQPADLPLFRARVHKPLNMDTKVPHLNRLPQPPIFNEMELIAPPSHLAKPGRLNPPGMSYFYAASDQATSIAETRPGVGSYVSVARFELVRSVKLVDCRLYETAELEAKQSKTMAEEYYLFWQNTVCTNFTIPFHAEDVSPYVPTQHYASAIKAKDGIDGILYNSAMHPDGFNICLFDQQLAKCVERDQKLINAIHYEYIPASRNDATATETMDGPPPGISAD